MCLRYDRIIEGGSTLLGVERVGQIRRCVVDAWSMLAGTRTCGVERGLWSTN